MTMLKAGRLLLCSTESCLYPRCTFVQNQSVQRLHTGRDEVLMQQLKHQETPDAIKKPRRKKEKSTSEISAEIDQTFKELKGRVIALRARELRILAGNLGTQENDSVSNPAHILNIKKKRNKHKSSSSAVENKIQLKQPALISATNEHHETFKNAHEEPNEELSNKTSTIKSSNKQKSAKSKSPDKELNEKTSRQPEVVERTKSLPMLVNYFDVYVKIRSMEEAEQHFKYLHSISAYSETIQNIQVYNVMLRGWSRKGDFSKVQELWKQMMIRGIKPDINSFIASIISFSHQDPSINLYKSVFRQVYDEFLKEGYTVEQALKQGSFQAKDRKLFLRTLDYFLDVPLPTTVYSNRDYTNPLLDNLPQNRNLLKSQVEGVITREELSKLYHQQSQLELEGYGKVTSIFAKKYNVSKDKIQFTEDLFDQWRTDLIKDIRNSIEIRLKNSSKKPFISMYLFVAAVPVEKVADIILNLVRELCEESDTFSASANMICYRLGTELFHAYLQHTKLQDETYLEDLNKIFCEYLAWYCSPDRTSSSTAANHRAAMQEALQVMRLSENDIAWSPEIIQMVGRELREILIRNLQLRRDRQGNLIVKKQVLKDNRIEPATAKVSSSIPAFYKIIRMRSKEGKMIDETKPHPIIFNLFADLNMKNLRFSVDQMPKVCPPMPWLDVHTGANFHSFPNFIRTNENCVSHQIEKVKALPEGGLNPILDAVNQLSSVPWKVNQAVLDLALEVFTDQKDEKVMDILQLPLHPDAIGDISRPKDKLSIEEMQKYYKDLADLQKDKKESYSLWCDSVYRLSLANHFRDNILWFPHNMDFRGRVYPMPPYLNHMGNDLAKALLVFARGKPLGPNGLQWLKLHCINLTGLKKRDSVQERLKYADNNMNLILDTAEKRMEGERWFLESDEPWLTFSVCNEIKAALEHPGGPENYISHLPIHQDGSCNGLQHYAAIGRDKLGAASVNLVPADKPQDVYSEIATLVDKKRSEDAAKGNDVAQVLQGFVQRKVIKQTVMTTVYGVTKYGATKQIAKQLADISDFPAEYVTPGSKYLSAKTFESLNELFTASQEIQDWLTECAKVISTDCKANVEWTTPLGLPVEQPYTSKVIATTAPSIDSRPNLQKMVSGFKYRVNSMKHRNGFAPNFIHSLDSSHMMLTSLYLWRLGINFASVHDCYWTHACDVDKMNKVCRDQFVALHSYPILESLSESFKEKFLNPSTFTAMETEKPKMSARKSVKMQMDVKKREMLFSNIPQKGELNLEVVKDSTYFFS